jgi:hypothetical protein
MPASDSVGLAPGFSITRWSPPPRLRPNPPRCASIISPKARMVAEDDDGADDDVVCDYARSFARDLLAMNATA